jgi:hypothetical protein
VGAGGTVARLGEIWERLQAKNGVAPEQKAELRRKERTSTVFVRSLSPTLVRSICSRNQFEVLLHEGLLIHGKPLSFVRLGEPDGHG